MMKTLNRVLYVNPVKSCELFTYDEIKSRATEVSMGLLNQFCWNALVFVFEHMLYKWGKQGAAWAIKKKKKKKKE